MIKIKLLLYFAIILITQFKVLWAEEAGSKEIASQPVVGEWAEYIISYPADPLEARLLDEIHRLPEGKSLSSTLDNIDTEPGVSVLNENLSSSVWNSFPVRIKFLEISAIQYKIQLTTLSGQFIHSIATSEFILPVEGMVNKIQVGQKTNNLEKITKSEQNYQLGEKQLKIIVEKANDSSYVRWSNSSVPFEFIRYTTNYLDVLLTGTGKDTEPDFPIAKKPASEPWKIFN